MDFLPSYFVTRHYLKPIEDEHCLREYSAMLCILLLGHKETQSGSFQKFVEHIVSTSDAWKSAYFREHKKVSVLHVIYKFIYIHSLFLSMCETGTELMVDRPFYLTNPLFESFNRICFYRDIMTWKCYDVEVKFGTMPIVKVSDYSELEIYRLNRFYLSKEFENKLGFKHVDRKSLRRSSSHPDLSHCSTISVP